MRRIGDNLNVSHATIVDDLKLLETHWSEVVEQSADDLLLEQLRLLQFRLRKVMEFDMLKSFGHCSPPDFARIYQAHVAEQATLLRETRRTVAQLQERAALRGTEAGEIPLELDYPEDELAAPPRPTNRTEPNKPEQPDLPELTKPDHPNHSVPSKTLENLAPLGSERTPDLPLEQQIPDQLMKEAQAFLEQHRKQDFAPAAG
ncbi:MAG: hypothetical protein OXN86_02600 [Chloroflexota bacterium]|nr:hypothetical protein [Chloroflexota bacterium]